MFTAAANTSFARKSSSTASPLLTSSPPSPLPECIILEEVVVPHNELDSPCLTVPTAAYFDAASPPYGANGDQASFSSHYLESCAPSSPLTPLRKVAPPQTTPSAPIPDASAAHFALPNPRLRRVASFGASSTSTPPAEERRRMPSYLKTQPSHSTLTNGEGPEPFTERSWMVKEDEEKKKPPRAAPSSSSTVPTTTEALTPSTASHTQPTPRKKAATLSQRTRSTNRRSRAARKPRMMLVSCSFTRFSSSSSLSSVSRKEPSKCPSSRPPTLSPASSTHLRDPCAPPPGPPLLPYHHAAVHRLLSLGFEIEWSRYVVREEKPKDLKSSKRSTSSSSSSASTQGSPSAADENCVSTTAAIASAAGKPSEKPAERWRKRSSFALRQTKWCPFCLAQPCDPSTRSAREGRLSDRSVSCWASYQQWVRGIREVPSRAICESLFPLGAQWYASQLGMETGEESLRLVAVLPPRSEAAACAPDGGRMHRSPGGFMTGRRLLANTKPLRSFQCPQPLPPPKLPPSLVDGNPHRHRWSTVPLSFFQLPPWKHVKDITQTKSAERFLQAAATQQPTRLISTLAKVFRFAKEVPLTKRSLKKLLHATVKRVQAVEGSDSSDEESETQWRRVRERVFAPSIVGDVCACDVYLVREPHSSSIGVWGFTERTIAATKPLSKSKGKKLVVPPTSVSYSFFICQGVENYLRLAASFGWIYGWQLSYAPCGPPASSLLWLKLFNPTAVQAAKRIAEEEFAAAQKTAKIKKESKK